MATLQDDAGAEPRPLLLSFEDAAKRLGLSAQTLHNWRSAGRLPFPSVRLGGRRLVRLSDLEAFVAGLSCEKAAEPTPTVVPLPDVPLPPRRGRPRLAATTSGGRLAR